MTKVTPEQIAIFDAAHQSLFREYLLSALVKAGALTSEEAAQLCDQMSTEAFRYLNGLEAAPSLLEAVIDRWAGLAGSFRGQDPKPKGL